MIKIEMLRCFRAVADHGSLTLAAESLGRTPSAVSMMLKQFDDHIGSPLFETARKSKLTPLGEAIYAEARRELDHFDAALATIEGLANSNLGIVRLAVTPSVAVAIMPPLMRKFVDSHPDVQIDLRDMESAAVLETMMTERADIGIGTFPETGMLKCTALFSDSFGVVCRRDHPLTETGRDLTWDDLTAHKFIANRLCNSISDPEFRPVLAASRILVPNTASLLGLVSAGIGITILPRLALLQYHDELTFLPLVQSLEKRAVHLVAQPQQRLTPAARSFLALIHQAHDKGTLVDDPN